MARLPQKFFKQYEFKRDKRWGSSNSSRTNSVRGGGNSLAYSGPRAFQVRSRGILPVFKKVERDISRITSVKIHYVDYEDDDEGGESRVEIQIICQSGIRKTYRLTCFDTDYEGTLDYPVHKENYPHKFEMQAKLFKKYIDSMSPQAEELSIAFKENCLELYGFTEEVRWVTEILKQPINTKIRLDYEQLGYLNLEDGITIRIRLKEFRYIVNLADSMGAKLLGWYKEPGMPMFFEIVGGDVNGAEELGDLRAFFMASGEKKKDTERHRHYKERVSDLRGSPVPSGLVNQKSRSQQQPRGDEDPEDRPGVGWKEDDEDDDEEDELALDQEFLQFSQRVTQDRQKSAGEDDENNDNTLHRQLDEDGDEIMSDREVGPTPGKSQAYGLFD